MTVSSATSSTTTPSTTSSTSSSSTSSSASTVTTSGTNTTTGVDWNALIQSEVQAALAGATPYQTELTNNQAKVTAYQTLQSDLSTFATDLLSLASSTDNQYASNVFASSAASISATGNINAASALSMTVNNGVVAGDHTLQITQLATAQKVGSSMQSSDTTALGYSGTFSIGLTGGSSASITIGSSMTMQDIVNTINAQSSTTNVQASIVQVSSGSYEMVLSATQDNATIAYSSTSGTDVLNSLGFTNSSGAFANVLQTQQAAEFNLDGISMTRNSNTITDALSGVTFNLLQATPSGDTLNITIGPNVNQIATAIQTLVTDYNKVRSFVQTQSAVNSDGTAASSAVLFGDSTMNEMMNELQGVLTTSVNGYTMADLGLSFDSNNQLQLNTNTLSTFLDTNPSGAAALLSAESTTSSSQLVVVEPGTSPQSFTMDLTVDGSGNLTSASVNGDSSMFTVNGTTITGNAGTAYAGMTFTYTGTTSQSITVTSTSGLAAQLYQTATNFSQSSGSLQTLIGNLQTNDTNLQTKINTIDASAATLQTQLQNQYAQYQSQILTADNTLNYLSALLNANSKSN